MENGLVDTEYTDKHRSVAHEYGEMQYYIMIGQLFLHFALIDLVRRRNFTTI